MHAATRLICVGWQVFRAKQRIDEEVQQQQKSTSTKSNSENSTENSRTDRNV